MRGQRYVKKFLTRLFITFYEYLWEEVTVRQGLYLQKKKKKVCGYFTMLSITACFLSQAYILKSNI